MKKSIIKYYAVFILAAVFFACTDDLNLQEGKEIREGIPVTVSVDLGVSSSKIVTRAAESDETERTVNRLYLFVFNSDGSLDNKQLFTLNESTLGCIESIESFPMHSGRDKRFYAIANPTSGSGTLSAEILAGVETEGELLGLSSKLLIPTNIERSYFLMSGKMETEKANGQIDVDESGKIIGAYLCGSHNKPIIRLSRVDARITFKIKGISNDSNYEDFKFVPDRYWVENIPQYSYVFPHDTDYSSGQNDSYGSMSEANVQRNVEGVDNDGYYYFEFYIPENRLEPKKRIVAGDAEKLNAESLYALREKQEKISLGGEVTDKVGQTETNGEFVYANKNSTYVVFHGILSYTDKSSGQRFVYADATYTVHLGETGKANQANDAELVNNYNTQRNTHYTYTVTIQGVKSMRVEVKDDREEQRPGVEGDVIYSGDAVEEMDAHYGRTQFTLTRGNIKDGLSWAIRTPFQSGMKPFDPLRYKLSGGKVLTDQGSYTDEEWAQLQTDLTLNDYKWVQFLINKEAGVASDQFAKYPGYASYVGDGYENVVIDVPAPPFGGEGAVPPSNYGSKSVVLYDVNQLLNHLYAEAINDKSEDGIFDRVDNTRDNDRVTITAFVDEYVYVYDPTKIYYRSPEAVQDINTDGIDLTLWKKTANRDNRMLYLCTTGAEYSDDGETSVSNNVFTIAQKPIYTFYNTNDPDVRNGWGTESVNETGPISYRPSVDDDEFSHTRYKNENARGLVNTLAVVDSRNLKWSDVMFLDPSDREDQDGTLNLQDKYNNIWYACIARNRDLDGDDIVDNNEVRWYLASIDQLTDIWIGQWSLNESAWLYHGDGTVRSHVASSTYYMGTGNERNTPTNPMVIWAEEGASKGARSGSSEYNGKTTSGSNTILDADIYGDGSHYHYRCVRNLGISLNDPTADFNPYVTVDSENNSYVNEDGEQYDEIVLSIDRMESNSIRSAIVQDTEQPEHTERQYTNRPYRKFAVIKDNDFHLLGYGSWTDYNNAVEDNVKICPSGYRIPNQRELMLMYINIDNNEMVWFDPDGNQFVKDENEHQYGDRHYICRTSFGYDSIYEGNRPGFMYDPENGLLYLETNRNHGTGSDGYGYVRCVRDVPE